MAKVVGPLFYYKWHWRDWRASLNVHAMSWQARGLFRELLDGYWKEGILPADPAKMAKICRCPVEEINRYWPEIEPCWERVEDGWRNQKMDEQRTEMDTVRATKSRAGRVGAFAKMASAGICHIEEKEKRREEKESGRPAAAASPEASAFFCSSRRDERSEGSGVRAQGSEGKGKSNDEKQIPFGNDKPKCGYEGRLLGERDLPGNGNSNCEKQIPFGNDKQRGHDKTGEQEPPAKPWTSKLDAAIAEAEPYLREIVVRVHAAYLRLTCKSADYLLTKKRRLHAMCRAEELWKRHDGDLTRVEADMVRAVTNLTRSTWHREHGQLDWHLIFDSQDAFTQRLAMQAVAATVSQNDRFHAEDFDDA